MDLQDKLYYIMDNELNSELISLSVVVRDSSSGEIRVYNTNEYNGLSKYDGLA